MPKAAAHSISNQGGGLEQASTRLVVEGKDAARRLAFVRGRTDFLLGLCGTGAWLYTIISLIQHL
jgi:hypothetical protein